MAKAVTIRKPRHIHLSGKDREAFTDNLAMLLHAGVAMGEALESLQETSRSKAFKKALAAMQQDIDNGLPLWQALQRSSIVSDQTLALVRSGEQSGKLVENMRVAAKQEEKQRIFKSKVRSALLYPTFVLGLTVIVGLGVAWFLLPKLADTFSQLHAELPFISAVLINLGLFLKSQGYWAVPAAIASLATLGFIFFVAPGSKNIGHAFLFHLPGIGRLMREIETARFGYLLGTLLNAGLGITQAFESLQAATSSPYYKNLYTHLMTAFDEGYNFKASFQEYPRTSKLLPPATMQMVIAGERSGALADTLLTIGKTYEQKADITTNNLAVILEPILLIIVWLGVMGVAVAVIMPIYSLIGGLQTI